MKKFAKLSEVKHHQEMKKEDMKNAKGGVQVFIHNPIVVMYMAPIDLPIYDPIVVQPIDPIIHDDPIQIARIK